MPLVLSCPDLAASLAIAASDALEVQLLSGHAPGELLAMYDQHAKTGYRQLPFLHLDAPGREPSMVWVAARQGDAFCGLLGAITVPGASGSPIPLADALAAGLLYPSNAAFSADVGWLKGEGPPLAQWGPSLYFGGVWVHPAFRGRGLVGVLSRLAALYALTYTPNLQTFWALEEAAIRDTRAMTRPGGLGLRHEARVFEGFFPIIGRKRVMYANWASRPEYLEMLSQDWEHLQVGAALPWLSLAPRPLT